TIMVWFKAGNPDNSTEQVLYEEGGGSNGFNLYLENGRLYAGAWSDTNGWGESYLNTRRLEPNHWYHAALVLSVSQNQFQLYLDGELADSTAGQAVAFHSGDIGIGAIVNESRFSGTNKIFTDGNWFSGQLDDLQIWNMALTPADINHYRYDAPASDEPGLVAHWPMNEGGGLTLNEVTSTPSHGTLSGAQWSNTPTWGIFYWDTYASGFFGQSSQMVVRLLAITQPSTAAAPGTYHYFDSIGLAAEPRPYIAATTAPFRVRGTQVQLFEESAARGNEIAGGVVFQRSGPEGVAQPISNPQTNEPYISNNEGFLDGRGLIRTADQLFAAVPYTKTYRIPPQAVFSGGGDSYGYVLDLTDDPENAFTAETWLLAESVTGSIFKKTNAFALDNPANLQVTINGQSVNTGISVLDGLPH
ncbi:MAG: LamG domain-containing protein, partial [Anaerolineales bacterium]|nr:LamG domain-containing protein [Anaerolineales bacterium]